MRKIKIFISLLFVFAFFVMVISQIFLKNDFFKNKLSVLYEMESMYVYSEKMESCGYVVIEISAPSENLFLMQNGEKILNLSKKQVKINVQDNSVIEVDGRKNDAICKIKITEISDNTEGFYEKEIEVKSNIVILGRFFVK